MCEKNGLGLILRGHQFEQKITVMLHFNKLLFTYLGNTNNAQQLAQRLGASLRSSTDQPNAKHLLCCACGIYLLDKVVLSALHVRHLLTQGCEFSFFIFLCLVDVVTQANHQQGGQRYGEECWAH